MRYQFLSHIYTNEQPVYGGTAEIKIDKIKSINAGDSSNVFQFTIQNHWGTHVDAPNHFFENGRKVADYPPEFWFFAKPQIIDVELNMGEILVPGDWLNGIGSDTDILLFRSGWCKRRNDRSYTTENPGIHPDIGICLRKNYPNLRTIGIDWISLSSYLNRELGREAHKAFLDPKEDNEPILIIEDMYLSGNLNGLVDVLVFPLMIEQLDSAPCTVIGVLE